MLYEIAVKELEYVLPNDLECPKGNELHAFLYRLFMSYEDSLPEIKQQLEDSPSPMNLDELKEESERLITEFLAMPLGNRWAKLLPCDGGLKHFANYFMHHRKDFTEENEQTFFYTLDKICIIEDIMKGNAEKYWLEVEYPEGWLETGEELIALLSDSRQAILNKLMTYTKKGDWIPPATVSGIQMFLKTVLGVGEMALTGDDARMSAALWKMLEQGRGDDRVVLVMQNLVGYFVSRGWLSKGSPALNKTFFGKEDGYPNIDKGNPQSSGISAAFRSVLPLLDQVKICPPQVLTQDKRKSSELDNR